jgi:hypothetical protein
MMLLRFGADVPGRCDGDEKKKQRRIQEAAEIDFVALGDESHHLIPESVKDSRNQSQRSEPNSKPITSSQYVAFHVTS